ncbi:phosphoglycerate dehydrogenase [Halanaerobium sp. Z-7514]|uniref:D-3-phosphoglycerate dehydrogenase n=1 Tax=Halanaerobium polyolivorans TaxID=2886943 RepID=A0AAW4X286_9FIRM|nr:phosphoglycerate dehydrogenase [Halanaerobium polyolivorans]
MYKVLVSDNISQKGIDILEEAGMDVDFKPEQSRDDFLENIADYDGIIVRSMTQLDKEVLAKAKSLKVIGRAGTGYDNIDLDQATKRGIFVFNTPTGNTISAVEHTLGLMLALARNIPQANQALHNDIWDRKKYQGVEIKGKTLGIIGLGRIGSRVAKRAQSFGMNVIANDPYLAPEKAENINVPLKSFEEVIKESDYVSLHTPLTDETYHILSHKEFAMMDQNTRVINCARGQNIDTAALAKAIEENKIAGAAIDVHEEEPVKASNNPLLKYPDQVIMTCHLGGTTTEAMDNVAIMAAEEVVSVLKNNLPESPLNIPAMDPQEFIKAKPYINLVTKLGNFMAKWKGHHRIKSIEVEYAGEVNNYSHKPMTLSLVKSVLEPILDDRINLVNAMHIAEERGINVKESQTQHKGELNNIITVRLNTNKGKYSLAGTYLPIGFRVIEINGLRVDLDLSGEFIIVTYQDRPGVIGKIGTTLGEENINIANMQVGRQTAGGEAVMLMQIDSKPSSETMGKIKDHLDALNTNVKDLSYIAM